MKHSPAMPETAETHVCISLKPSRIPSYPIRPICRPVAARSRQLSFEHWSPSPRPCCSAESGQCPPWKNQSPHHQTTRDYRGEMSSTPSFIGGCSHHHGHTAIMRMFKYTRHESSVETTPKGGGIRSPVAFLCLLLQNHHDLALHVLLDLSFRVAPIINSITMQ